MAKNDDLKFNRVPNSDGAIYQEIENHKPFVNGIHPDDVDQGLLGNCYFLSSIASIAQHQPTVIQNMIRPKADNSYDVSLFKRSWLGSLTPMTINVRARVPHKDGKVIFTRVGDIIENQNGRQVEVWPIILENAYAKMIGSYNKIIGGWPHHAMESLTGMKSEKINPIGADFGRLQQMKDRGYAMACYTRTDFKLWGMDLPDRTGHNRFAKNKQGGDLTAGHAYFISDVDAAAGTITVRNPWGWHIAPSVLTKEEFASTMRGVSVNPITARG